MLSRILIVEDDPAIAQMYLLKLTAEGVAVDVAQNGVIGLALAEKVRPDVILLDIMMPQMDGGEMLAKLRKTDWGKDMKVIILTNVGESEISDDITKLGVRAVVQKANHTPGQVTEIVKKVYKET